MIYKSKQTRSLRGAIRAIEEQLKNKTFTLAEAEWLGFLISDIEARGKEYEAKIEILEHQLTGAEEAYLKLAKAGFSAGIQLEDLTPYKQNTVLLFPGQQ
jgi:hypothetical protein